MRLICGVLLLATFRSSLLSQDTSAVVESYLRFLDEHTSMSRLSKPSTSISLLDLKRFGRLMYEATESDPVQVDRSIGKRHKEWDLKYAKTIPTRSIPWKVGMVEHTYLRRIDSVLSKRVYSLVRIPFFLRVVINSQTESIHMKYARTTIRATILDVAKGANRYSVRDTVTCYFNNFWIESPSYFRNGDTCLLLLEPRETTDGEGILFAVVPYLDRAFGYYVIRDGVLSDPYETFGYGKQVPWTRLKDSLVAEIRTIKSW